MIVLGLALGAAVCAPADDLDPAAKAAAAERGIDLKNETVEAGELIEGWSKTYDWSTLPIGGSPSKDEKIRLWVEQGWINVRATNDHGRTDWQVALCSPTVKRHCNLASISELKSITAFILFATDLVNCESSGNSRKQILRHGRL